MVHCCSTVLRLNAIQSKQAKTCQANNRYANQIQRRGTGKFCRAFGKRDSHANISHQMISDVSKSHFLRHKSLPSLVVIIDGNMSDFSRHFVKIIQIEFLRIIGCIYYTPTIIHLLT